MFHPFTKLIEGDRFREDVFWIGEFGFWIYFVFRASYFGFIFALCVLCGKKRAGLNPSGVLFFNKRYLLCYYHQRGQ